jgi:hypothetical protein
MYFNPKVFLILLGLFFIFFTSGMTKYLNGCHEINEHDHSLSSSSSSSPSSSSSSTNSFALTMTTYDHIIQGISHLRNIETEGKTSSSIGQYRRLGSNENEGNQEGKTGHCDYLVIQGLIVEYITVGRPTCYDAFAIAIFEGGNRTCVIEAVTNVGTKTDAIEITRHMYHKGEVYELYLRPNSNFCYNKGTLSERWLTGVVLLFIALFFAVCTVLYTVFVLCSTYFLPSHKYTIPQSSDSSTYHFQDSLVSSNQIELTDIPNEEILRNPSTPSRNLIRSFSSFFVRASSSPHKLPSPVARLEFNGINNSGVVQDPSHPYAVYYLSISLYHDTPSSSSPRKKGEKKDSKAKGEAPHAQWISYKRYSDFEELKQSLSHLALPSFPTKTLLLSHGTDKEVIEKRALSLSHWLMETIQIVKERESDKENWEILQHFLQSNANIRPVGLVDNEWTVRDP